MSAPEQSVASAEPSGAVRIRLAGSEDAAEIARLLAAFRDWWGRDEPSEERIRAGVERILADGDGEYLLASVDGAAVGVCQLRYRWSVWTGAPDCWLEDLFVSERARSRGVGRRLVEAAVERASARGCKRIELDVNEGNEAARALYRSCGFSETPKGPDRTLFVARKLP